MLKLKVIACDVLRREVSYLASLSPCYVEVTFLPQGLHSTPDKLRVMLGEEIEKASEGITNNKYGEKTYYDFIVLAYGLCENSILNLSSPVTPLVIPRAHDCITLLLGSKDRYGELFNKSPGTYWYSRGWIECTLMPGEDRYKKIRDNYAAQYGEENADYLMEMEQGWFKSYDRVIFINWDELGNADYYREYTKKSAEYLKWNYIEENGSSLLMKKMLSGIFDESEVQIIPPGMIAVASFDDAIIKAVVS